MGDFAATVVPRISALTPDLPHDVLASAHDATAAMVAFDRESGGLASLPFAAVLLRGESATSSQTENLTVRARKLSLAAVGARIGGNAELVARTVKAMRAAIAAASHLDSRRRVTAPLRAVADLCCSEPAFTAGMVENLAGISKATAYRTVDALTDAGLLRQEPSIKVRGQKAWVVPAVVKALEDFAERAGRRTFGS
ncbi:hypothetical protein [Kocuria sp.]|uniref:hypothetical protein n=1 Tax=Kocuria sp. TaxID=1871328 RepID=UPI00289E857A|nr:hypothetical protein [Kocuria sp.]